MSVTVTFHLWWLGAYLAAGVVMFPVLAWRYIETTSPRPTWRRTLGRRGTPWRHWFARIGITIAAWPLATWEAFR